MGCPKYLYACVSNMALSHRFCVSVQRENFPPDPPFTPHSFPAHTLTLLPPLTIANLLPYDIQVLIGHRLQCKMIRKGTEIAVYLVSRLFGSFCVGIFVCDVVMKLKVSISTGTC